MGKQPKPFPSLKRNLKEDRSLTRRIQNASPFFGTGISPTGSGGMESDDFDGDLDAGNAGTKGWAFNSARVAIGELLLRPGSIGNDALANPTAPGSVYATATGFAMTTSFATKVSQTVTVPAGFTSAAVTLNGSIFAYNQNPAGTGVDYLYSQAWIDTVHGAATPLACTDNGGSGKNPCAMSTVLTGLTPGGTFTVLIAGQTAFNGWPAHTSMLAELSGTITWYR